MPDIDTIDENPAQLLSPHFTLVEFCRSQTARESGMRNTPGPGQIKAMENLCQKSLEPLRSSCSGLPMSISSGYRSPKVNAATGGSPTSQHMSGEGADIGCDQFGAPIYLGLRVIWARIPFDQMIIEFADPTGKDVAKGWLHLSNSSSRANRYLVNVKTKARDYDLFNYKDFQVAWANAPQRHREWLAELDARLRNPAEPYGYGRPPSMIPSGTNFNG